MFDDPGGADDPVHVWDVSIRHFDATDAQFVVGLGSLFYEHVVAGKAGQRTGAWDTEILSMDLSGGKSGESIIYVNGEQLGGASDATFTNIAEGANVTIGQGHQGGRWFNGRIDEVAIYDSALSLDRVVTHFLAGGGTGVTLPEPEPDPAELLAHWTFDTDASEAYAAASTGGGGPKLNRI